jgi:hypothetical protein
MTSSAVVENAPNGNTQATAFPALPAITTALPVLSVTVKGQKTKDNIIINNE